MDSFPPFLAPPGWRKGGGLVSKRMEGNEGNRVEGCCWLIYVAFYRLRRGYQVDVTIRLDTLQSAINEKDRKQCG